MKTAEEIRKMMPTTLEDKLKPLLMAIEKKALEGDYRLKTGWEYKQDNDLWIEGGYNKTPEWKSAKKRLEDLGFQVKFFYKEYSIAVDMYTLISWEVEND